MDLYAHENTNLQLAETNDPCTTFVAKVKYKDKEYDTTPKKA